jgi:hypothetical protein
MRRLAPVVAAVLIILALVGCGSSGHNHFVDDKIDNNYSEVKLPYRGTFLICVRSHFTTSSGNSRSDWGGISCDWVEYHRRTEK